MTEQIECDFLVFGAGMAGLSAAARAAEAGARVIVVEKQARPGGSALLSGGVTWTIQTPHKLNGHTRGRPELGALVSQGYREAVAWLRTRGVQMSPAMAVLRGQGYEIDIVQHVRDCMASVEKAGGHVALASSSSHLTLDDAGAVRGALVEHADGAIEVASPWTLLATGGFQADPELRARHIHPAASAMRLRSNPASDGGGLRLGLGAGGEFRGDNPGFYGHLVTASPDWGDPRLFTTLSQYHSEVGLLLNERGERFCDESEGDHVNTYAVLTQPGARALLVWDERIQQDHAITPLIAVAPPIDRFAIAMQRGGEGVIAHALAELAAFASRHGFDGAKAAETIAEYNRLQREGWERLDPVRTEQHEPLDRPPYYALIVHPAITYTFAGLTIDACARVLRADGSPVPGLLAAGADAGDVYRVGYAGGLAQALVLGLRAARTAGFADAAASGAPSTMRR
jgi:succinate dehydrogenase/fumarate reductase flavoprotein subunit